ncbi:hypothetical protein C943_03653 [Mariniradius saccharolyticus AK6]|uniref:Uncharacterized protein n=1 Tax=Mariniradius saccharolyticus AK6 TaxID=1239962 RepID=M7XHY8_9BACT|nr:hypothetical protein C943_03653 [Mariniradius saccharolyticus AK6]
MDRQTIPPIDMIRNLSELLGLPVDVLIQPYGLDRERVVR